MTTVSQTTNTTLHNILRCIQSGEVTRQRTATKTWVLLVNGVRVDDPEIQLGVSVLDAQGCVHWWPPNQPEQQAVLTLDKGRDRVRWLDHLALHGEQLRLRPEPQPVTSCLDDGPGAA